MDYKESFDLENADNMPTSDADAYLCMSQINELASLVHLDAIYPGTTASAAVASSSNVCGAGNPKHSDADGSHAATAAVNAVAAAFEAVHARRRKACVFCRRSHMTCDGGRPCSRCVKRRIGYLCKNEEAAFGGGCSGGGLNNENFAANLVDESSPFSMMAPFDPPFRGSVMKNDNPALYIPKSIEMKIFKPEEKQLLDTFRKRHVAPHVVPETANFDQYYTIVDSLVETYLDAQSAVPVGSFCDKVITEKYRLGLIQPFYADRQFYELKNYLLSCLSPETVGPGVAFLDYIRCHVAKQCSECPPIDRLKDEEIVEKLQSKYLRIYRTLTHPTAIWRLTGEIISSNAAFETYTNCRKDAPYSIYYLLAEKSVLAMLEKTSRILEHSSKMAMFACTFNGRAAACSASILLLANGCGVPYVVIGGFLPTGAMHVAVG